MKGCVLTTKSSPFVNGMAFLCNAMSREKAYSLLLGIVFSFSWSGLFIYLNRHNLTSPSGVIMALILLTLCFVVFSLFAFLAIRFSIAFFSGESASAHGVLRGLFETRGGLFACMAFLLLLWSPTIVLMYPFGLGPDTMAQLLWSQGFPAFDPSSRVFLPGYTMSDHHPFLLTLFYGVFYDLGKLLGNPAHGITLLCYLQTSFMAFVFAFSCQWLRRHCASLRLCLIALLFWGLQLSIPMLLQQLVKDITSLPFFLLFFMGFSDVYFQLKLGTKLKAHAIAGLILVVILGSLTRKVFLHICFASTLILLIVFLYKTPRDKGVDAPFVLQGAFKLLACSFVPLIVVSLLIPRALFPMLGIAPAGPQEVISIPIRQVSAVIVQDPESLSAEDRAAIEKVLPLDQIPGLYARESADPMFASADPVKDAWIRSSTTVDELRFLLTWIRLAPTHVKEYLQSIGYIYRFFLIGEVENNAAQVWGGWSDKGGAQLFPAYAENTPTSGQTILNTFYYQYIGQIPVVRLLTYTAFYQLWLPLFAFAVMKVRQSSTGTLFIPIIFSILTCLVVAAFQTRYAFYQLFAAPLILAIPYLKAKCSSNGTGSRKADEAVHLSRLNR